MGSKPLHNKELANGLHKVEASEHKHSVQFYSNDNYLLDMLSRFIGSALGAGDAGVIIATQEHRAELAKRLGASGLDLTQAVEQGRYVALDSAETLAQFMVDGWPDEKRFVELIGGVISRARAAAKKEQGRVALFGEMVALLWEQGRPEAALMLEQLWNQIAHSHSFSLVCAYPLNNFYREEHREAFLKICDEHSAVLPGESYSLAPEEDRMRMIAHWQQRAISSEAEMGKRRQTQIAAARLAAIVESSDDAIASKDLKGIVTSWNASAERIFGYKAEEIIGKPITLIIPPELHKDEDMILGKISRGERIDHFETVRVTKGGERIHVSLTISPLKDETGKIIGASKIARDITERKRTEEALRRAEKLAATGQLAASIAHEINNPMQALTNLIALIAYKTSLDESTRQLVSLAETEVKRMSHIVRQMLSFYRESVTPVSVQITEVLEDVFELFVMRMRSNQIKMERRYEFDGDIYGFPVELRQLFANLISNAIEAIGAKGQIVIHVAPWREPSRPERTGVRIVVADNGPGIKRDVQKRIFEPFFTTKAEKGTGLGLWVVKAVVTRHEGSIRVRSTTANDRSGTVFSVFLPLNTPLEKEFPKFPTKNKAAA
jgi:PAS domain S-box-containing protein